LELSGYGAGNPNCKVNVKDLLWFLFLRQILFYMVKDDKKLNFVKWEQWGGGGKLLKMQIEKGKKIDYY